MKKIRVFLDTSIIISYLRNEKSLRNLFSRRVLERVQYIINPIISQEILLVAESIREKSLLAQIYKYIKIIPLDVDFDKLMRFRNLMVHTNDILIIETATRESDYLLTLDRTLLKLNQLRPLEIISPKRFFKLLEEDL
ncbi:MAG: hypothetical protein CEE42_10200 [Promethearchaeota archaeon Loki_b31]|nr:MAG: hypothetical protein CEE42_10200 [Candidatus Lokiarchaeota archaeon Loki_b31]